MSHRSKSVPVPSPVVALLMLLVASAWAGCSCDETTSVGNGGGGGVGAQGGSGGGGLQGAGGSGGEPIIGGGGPTGGHTGACEPPCGDGYVCSHGTCVPASSCSTDDECQNDTHCIPDVGCVPWEGSDPEYDESCVQVIVPGVLSPAIQCEFPPAQMPADDPFPTYVDVQGTPMVVNFHKPMDSGPPSILASFTATVPSNYTEELGVIRILRGDDCTLEATLGGTDVDGDGATEWTVSSATLAVGDLDGDEVAEVVAYGSDGSTFAFTQKLVNWQHQWSLLWAAPHPSGAPWSPCDTVNHRCSVGWAGPAIHDLDDDGQPEVIREGVVLSSTGQLLSLQPPGYASYGSGLFPVLANLDDDAAIELTNGRYIWEWHFDSQTSTWAWLQETYFPGASSSAPGHVALADFGAFGTGAATEPELAVVRSGYAMVYARTGELAMAPILIPSGGGGAPTVSDFDGDGLPELAVAGADYYLVFDIDCTATPRPNGVCPVGTCDHLGGACAPNGGIAWSRQTQDHSSQITGSSIFDFEADGSAEAVYADECFVRVYRGGTGEVLFSQYRSSCTWYENPLIADVDGDFRAELVVPSNKACSVGGAGVTCSMLTNGVDPQFAGLRCETGTDCFSGQCDSGLCRCTAGAECCSANDDAACLEQGYLCGAPPTGTPGTGNTCRAAHPHGVSGIRVYNDANDMWVRSRQIWNQHAYAVTHINEDGTVPQTSQWQSNWLDPTLNNFRQNVPGNPNGSALGDTTAGAAEYPSCSGGEATLQVQICNRGSTAVPPNQPVGFYVGETLVCATQTSHALEPAECETVSCVWADPPSTAGEAVDVTVVADDGGTVTECKEENNLGTILGVFCQPPA